MLHEGDGPTTDTLALARPCARLFLPTVYERKLDPQFI